MKYIISAVALFMIFGCNHRNQERLVDELEQTVVQPEIINEGFDVFEQEENEREKFIKEIIELDSLTQTIGFQDSIINKSYAPKKLNVTMEDDVIILDFPQMYCNDYVKLKDEGKTIHLEKLRNEGKLKLTCRGIASDLDVFPKRTGDISQDCKIYLEAIKQLIGNNYVKLRGFTYDNYLSLEIGKNLKTDSQRFIFRKKFLKFLNEKYHVSIEQN